MTLTFLGFERVRIPYNTVPIWHCLAARVRRLKADLQGVRHADLIELRYALRTASLGLVQRHLPAVDSATTQMRSGRW